jgi:predicted Zn-dependent peptidase
MEVMLARVAAVPVVRVSLSLPGGTSADRTDRPGTQALLLALLDEGTNGRLGPLDGPAIARRFEALGGGVGADASLDRTRVTLSALTPNLRQSVALMADIVRAPTLPVDQLERLRGQTLTAIAQRAVDPNALASDAFFPRIYGPNHPYGRDPSGLGTAEAVRAVTRDDLLAQLPRSLRPDGATLIVVGDTDMATVKPMLEDAFGDWKGAGAPAAAIAAAKPVSAPPGILLIDRPGSPQSVILAGAVLPVTGRDDRLDVTAANEILGGSFLSRLNLDLREAKGWAYGASSAAPPTRLAMPLQISAPVQTDKTGPSVTAIREQLAAFTTTRPPTQKELDDARDYAVRRLPGNLETGSALLGQLERAVNLGRPDDWLQKLPARWAALTPAQLAAAPLPRPDELRVVVVGDRKLVEPQLRALNLPLVIAPTGGQSRPESGAPRPTPSGR